MSMPAAVASDLAGPTELSPGFPVSASLSEADSPGGPTVIFAFNPQKISIQHSAKLQEIAPPKPTDDKKQTPSDTGTTTDNNASLGYEDRIRAMGAVTITIADLVFAGGGTVADCAQLLDWSNAVIPPGTQNARMPTLTFTWGTEISYSVNLISVDVNYERFTNAGKPIRAKVTLKFQSIQKPATGTNPTSGGIPGRRSHTMVAGENLQHIATATYGKPGAWRALAAANGIEDPLAVQPGTVIYMPSPAELDDRGAR